jgi:hypothetical protein
MPLNSNTSLTIGFEQLVQFMNFSVWFHYSEKKKKRMGLKKIIIVPGNGCTPVEDCNWYGWLQEEVVDFIFQNKFEIDCYLC